MKHLKPLFEQAAESRWGLRKLNWALWYKLPFNRPHGIRLIEARPGFVAARLPFKRSNLNHLKTMHACALATVAEFSAGTCLLSLAWPFRYRLIMKSMHMEYMRRVESEVQAQCTIESERLSSWLNELDAQDGRILIPLKTLLFDAQGNAVAEGITHWHIKRILD